MADDNPHFAIIRIGIVQVVGAIGANQTLNPQPPNGLHTAELKKFESTRRALASRSYK